MTTDAEVKPEEVVDSELAGDELSKEEPKPSPEPEMLTKEQAEKLANERHSKLDKRIAELEKTTAKQVKALEVALTRAKAAEDALAQAERKSLGEDSDALSLYEAKLQAKKDHDALQVEMATYAEEIADAKQYRISKMADEIAAEYGVDPSLLISLTDGTRVKMENLAKVLPQKEDEQAKKTPKKPDSLKTIGGSREPTAEDLEKMSPEDYAEWAKKRYK